MKAREIANGISAGESLDSQDVSTAIQSTPEILRRKNKGPD